MAQLENVSQKLWHFSYTSEGNIDYTDLFPLVSPSTKESLEGSYDALVIRTLAFLYSNWTIPIVLSFLYLGTVFGLQSYMTHRKPFKLKTPLVIWNLGVSIFSSIGFFYSFPEILKFFGKSDGFYESICIPNYERNYIYAAVVFCLSKIPELVDTLFVVCRKKPLEAAQWYHHVVTVIGTWITAPYAEPVTRYIVVINYGVHSVMYLYFALKVGGVKVPRRIAKTITTLQFSQMVFIFFCNGVSAYYFLSGSRVCYRHPVSLLFVCAVNFTFLIIFGQLFHKLVIQKKTQLFSSIESNKTK